MNHRWIIAAAAALCLSVPRPTPSCAGQTPTNATAVVIKESTATAPPAPAPAPREPTTVTSERLQVDYANNLGTFQGNVLVVDSRMMLRADKMVVFFGGGVATNATSGSIQKIIAEGGVVITTPDKRKATGENAVYTAEDGKTVLTGNPQVENGQGTVTGKKITFWQNDQRMDVESDTHLVIFPDAHPEANKKPASATESKPGPGQEAK